MAKLTVYVNRNRQVVLQLTRIADALERAFPVLPPAPDIPTLDADDIVRGGNTEEKLREIVSAAVAAGHDPDELLDYYFPEEYNGVE